MFRVSCAVLYDLVSYPFLRLFNGMNCPGNLSIKDEVMIVTGSNTGIGKAVSEALAQRGAKVIMACRDLEKANSARDDILKRVPDAKLSVMKVDMGSLDSVRTFAEQVKTECTCIDALINNAGLFTNKYSKTVDDYEIHWQVNYLSHFLLTLLLMELLQKSSNPKVVNVSALGHIQGKIDFEDMDLKQGFSAIIGYTRSKLAQVLFTKEMCKRIPSVKTYSLHPGVVSTDIPRNLDSNWADTLTGRFFKSKLVKTSMEGCQPIIHCLCDEKADKETGLYYEGCNSVVRRSDADSDELQKKLWEQSLEMVNITVNNYPRRT